MSMSEFLFDVKETLSPKLAWMLNHGIKVHETPEGLAGQEDEFGYEIEPFYAYTGEIPFNEKTSEGGKTEEEALTRLATKLKIKAWYEL